MNTQKHKYLINSIKTIISQARSLTARSVNALQVASNYMVGKRIVEFEQGGSERAEYGKTLLKDLSVELAIEFGRGYSQSNLEYMRKFYLMYSKRVVQKSQTGPGEFISDWAMEKSQTVSGKSGLNHGSSDTALEIARALKRQFDSSLYERLALSRDNDEIKKLAQKGM